MALDKLVDSTQLDACNTAEADAIRAKTGGLSPIPYDFANNKGFADAIAAIPSGGGGEVLLGSGTYTLASDASSMEIPISVLGTPTCCFVEAESVSSAGLQTYAWCGYNQQHDVANTLFPRVSIARGARETGVTNVILLPSAPTEFSDSQITVRQVSNTYTIRANTYKWYVWGTAT